LVTRSGYPTVCCPGCGNAAVIRNGHDEQQSPRQRYRCKACHRRFDDLTGTVLAGHHQPLRVWVLCLYLMGLNLSNERGSVRRLWREKRVGV
jgi:transposase-like protein